MGSAPGEAARTAGAWLLAAIAGGTSLRKIGTSPGAAMPTFTQSPTMRVMRISIESPMTIDSLIFRERTSMGRKILETKETAKRRNADGDSGFLIFAVFAVSNLSASGDAECRGCLGLFDQRV